MEAMNLSQSLAGVIGQKWPTSFTLMMVGSFAMNTASQEKATVDLLLVPDKQQRNQFEDYSQYYGVKEAQSQVPSFAEIYDYLKSLPTEAAQSSLNIKIEYDSLDQMLVEKGHLYSESHFRPQENALFSGKVITSALQSRTTPAKYNEWSSQINSDCIPQLVCQADHEDCHSFVFSSSIRPEVKARLFISTSIGNCESDRQMNRFNASSLHASWIRLVSGEEIQLSVMHALFLIRLIR